MKLFIDAQALQSSRSRDRGIGRYARGLVAALRVFRPEWSLTLIENASLPSANDKDIACRRFRPIRPDDESSRDFSERYLGDWINALDPDALLLLSTSDDEVVLPRFFDKRPRVCAILYDLIPLLFARAYLRGHRTRDRLARGLRALCRSDQILAISQSAGADFARILPDHVHKVSVIGGAADPFFQPTAGAEWCGPVSRAPVDQEFILVVGGSDFRKNLRSAIAAYALLPQAHRAELNLVIVCALDAVERTALEAYALQLGVAHSIHFTGFVSDAELRRLYCRCRLFFFPSLYEGLGIPVLEALQCGAPVVTSNVSALPECAGHASWLVDPGDVKDCLRGLLAALAEPRNARVDLRLRHVKQFSWDQVAGRMATSLESFARASRAHRKPRIAWVSPMPPEATGVADYSAAILELLQRRYSIDIVTGEEAVARQALGNRWLRARELLAIHGEHPYDAIVYQIGNSRFHAYMLPLLARLRGLVVLHDLLLGGLIRSAIRAGLWSRNLPAELERAGESSLAHALAAGQTDENAILSQVSLCGSILAHASRVAVHSAWTAVALKEHTDLPIDHINMPMPVGALGTRKEERRRLDIGLDRFLLVSLGTVGETTRLPSILASIQRLPESLRQRVEFVAVGYAPPLLQAELLETARGLGLAARVRFTGRVPTRDFAAYARAADVCVQLRHPTRGETSAALLQALAAGAACLVSAAGPGEEVPDETVIKIRADDSEVSDIVRALIRLAGDPEERRRLEKAAADHICQAHSLEGAAEQYSYSIDQAILERKRFGWLEAATSALSPLPNREVRRLARTWARLRSWGQLQLGSQAIRRR